MINHFGPRDPKDLLAFYAAMIGLLVSKSGPVTITTDDVTAFEISGLMPFIDPNIEGGFRIILMAEDEIKGRQAGTWNG